MKEENKDAIDRIKKENDKSAGNLLNSMPIKVELSSIDLSFIQNTHKEHPRLLIQNSDLSNFNKTDCKFDEFYQNSVLPYLEVTPYDEPEPYPEETVGKASLWRPYWRAMYVQCQRALNATRNLSIAGILLDDKLLISKAKEWVLKLISYDTKGVTSRAYNDEAAFRVITSIAWGYDWLYRYLSEEERGLIRDVLIIRLEEIMHHLIESIDLLSNPLNSHGVRSISSAVVPVSIVLLHDYPKAKEYLEYSIEYYSVHYPPWGGSDGGWAEGPDYWNTAMAFLGEAFDLIKSYTNINLFNKEFYKNTGDFILYCMPVHSKRASFGDQSSIGDYPGLKLAYNIRHFAGINSRPEYVWYYNQLKARDREAHTKFYNFGWWDFGYDDLRYNYLWEDLEATEPNTKPLLKVFPETGWAAFHNQMTDRENHLHMIFKCSPFGSISHSHGDQGAFTFHAFGETLASITGYYGGYGVDMHLKWRRHTFSKNAVLFDGKGQYAENSSSKYPGHRDTYCVEAGGNIIDFDTEGDIKSVEGDATASYKFFNPDLESYKRKIWFIDGKYFVIRDRATLKTAQELTWLLHTTFSAETSNSSFSIKGEKGILDVDFLNVTSNSIKSVETVEGFGDVDPNEYKDLEIHKHIETKFKTDKEFDIFTILTTRKVGEEKKEITYERSNDQLILTVDGLSHTIKL